MSFQVEFPYHEKHIQSGPLFCMFKWVSDSHWDCPAKLYCLVIHPEAKPGSHQTIWSSWSSIHLLLWKAICSQLVLMGSGIHLLEIQSCQIMKAEDSRAWWVPGRERARECQEAGVSGRWWSESLLALICSAAQLSETGGYHYTTVKILLLLYDVFCVTCPFIHFYRFIQGRIMKSMYWTRPSLP